MYCSRRFGYNAYLALLKVTSYGYQWYVLLYCSSAVLLYCSLNEYVELLTGEISSSELFDRCVVPHHTRSSLPGLVSHYVQDYTRLAVCTTVYTINSSKSLCTTLFVHKYPCPFLSVEPTYVQLIMIYRTYGTAVVVILQQVWRTTGSTQTCGGHHSIVVLVHPIKSLQQHLIPDTW